MMSSQRERQLWTEYAEMRQRQRTQTVRKPRAKRVKGPTPEELEQRSTILSARPSG
jgi:hypothetical protein